MKFELGYWIAILRVRIVLFFAIATLVVTTAVFLAMNLPTTYESSADLLVENPQIPGDLAASTVRTGPGEQLQVIQQQLLTRQNLLDIADRLALYPPTATPDQIVRDLRDRIVLRLRGGREQATIMSVTADAENAQTAADIVNDVVNQFLVADSNFRNNVAEQTLDFFEAERTRLGEELDILSGRILDFKNRNSDALPDSLDYRLDRQSLLQERLASIQRDLSQWRDQQRRLEELEAQGRVPRDIPGVQRTPEEQELQQLRAELDRLRAVFSDENPQIRILQARIERQEQRIAEQATPQPSAETPDEESVAVGIVQVQLQDVAARIEDGETRAAALEQDIAAIQDTIDRTPANSIALNALERDLENIQGQYNRAVERLSTAATGERIEVLSKGQRLVLLEEAAVPTRPASPNRPLIIAAGIVAGVLLGGGAVILAEILRPYFRRSSEITNALDIAPLATLPYYETPGERFRRRFARASILMIFLVGIPVGIWAFDTYVMPVERVADGIRGRLHI